MKRRPRLKLLLVDDHELVREGLRSSLASFPEVHVVGEAADGKEALRKCRELRPDIILLDLNMPEMSGLEAAPLLRKQCPRAKIIALTVHDTREYVYRVLRDGAQGFVRKDTSPAELWNAIQAVARGDAFFSPSISRILLGDVIAAPDLRAENHARSLSEREREVLRLIAIGKTTKETAAQLNLSVRTVETYRIRLKRKLRARNLAELLHRAREERWL